jgi:hypothetical protein
VIAGATAPFGDPRTHPRDPNLPRMRPLTFLRKVLCLNEKLKATRCPSKPHLDALSHHPINFLNPPHYQAINPNDVEVADFHKVASVLHAAEHAGTIAPKARAHHPLWASELGWYTKPPSPFGVPATKQARWFEESLYLLWKQGASVAVNFLIRDRNTTSRFATTSGLFYKSGGQKPAYRAFRFPFVTQRKSKSEVSVWSMPPGSGTLKLQRRGRKGWRTLKRVPAHSGKVTTTKIRLRGRASLRGNLRGDTSLAWRQR